MHPSLFLANFLEPKINIPVYAGMKDRGMWTLPVAPDTRLAELPIVEEIMKQLGISREAAQGSDHEIAAQGVTTQVWMKSMSDYVDVKEQSTMVGLTTFKEFLDMKRETVEATHLQYRIPSREM
ncbi:hypothetical protein M434DRAFT_32245 [Hypoxylon sp. CO27-5]|nr:hypothetical protein M434DRAFT_32245 [Hypoxylon sp. CO27-5]